LIIALRNNLAMLTLHKRERQFLVEEHVFRKSLVPSYNLVRGMSNLFFGRVINGRTRCEKKAFMATRRGINLLLVGRSIRCKTSPIPFGQRLGTPSDGSPVHTVVVN
jgi:hypothetical protein